MAKTWAFLFNAAIVDMKGNWTFHIISSEKTHLVSATYEGQLTEAYAKALPSLVRHLNRQPGI